MPRLMSLEGVTLFFLSFHNDEHIDSAVLDVDRPPCVKRLGPQGNALGKWWTFRKRRGVVEGS